MIGTDYWISHWLAFEMCEGRYSCGGQFDWVNPSRLMELGWVENRSWACMQHIYTVSSLSSSKRPGMRRLVISDSRQIPAWFHGLWLHIHILVSLLYSHAVTRKQHLVTAKLQLAVSTTIYAIKNTGDFSKYSGLSSWWYSSWNYNLRIGIFMNQSQSALVLHCSNCLRITQSTIDHT